MSWLESWRPALLRPALHVAMAPEGLHYLLRAPWPGRILDHGHIPCVPSSPPWQASLAALAQLVALPAAKGAVLHVVLSHAFVRFQVLPWRPGVASPVEQQAYAGLRFKSVFGEASVEWQTCVDPVLPGEPALACAMPRALLAGLHHCVGNGLSLGSVQPQFALAFNRRIRSLKGDTVWFAVAEADRICLSLCLDGRWQSIRNESCGNHWPTALGGLLRRLQLPLGLGAGRGVLYLHCASAALAAADVPEQLNGMVVHRTEPVGQWTPDQRAVALALGY
ncbi:MAG: hypothetical protein EKK46_12235 [Rhodocyclaceae bacterium]|nr:MAG: hypothetical protein EKK46_12235 [Rhodocyclaceae bacterium]